MHTRTLASIVLCLVLAGTAHAQSALKLWGTHCASCHTGEGKPDLMGEKFRDRGDGVVDRRQFDAIVKGGMGVKGAKAVEGHAFGGTLKNEQSWALVVHLRELQAREARKRSGNGKPADGIHRTKYHAFRVRDVVAAGLRTPWAVEFLPDGAMLITEKGGTLRVFKDGVLSAPVLDLPASLDQGQGGLMDVALHPNHAANGWVYLAYNQRLEPGGKAIGMTKIVRGKLARVQAEGAPAWAWTEQQTIFEARPEHHSGSGVHFGCRIVFDPKNSSTLFFCIGERGTGKPSQDPTNPYGKVFRINDDGAVPWDNPFVAQNEKYYEAIWSYGHRNPQGLVFDLEGNLWDTEHGPRGGDELNLIEKGANYGWPLVAFSMNYSGEPLSVPWPEERSKAGEKGEAPPTITQPVLRWLPSIAACGLAVSTGGEFAAWKGDLLAGGLAGMTVQRVRVKVEGGKGVLVESEEVLYGLGRVRDVVCGPGGAVYVVLNGPDKVVRLEAVR